MDKPEERLKERLLQTLAEFEQIVGKGRHDLTLRVDQDTKVALSVLSIDRSFNVVCDLVDVDPRDQFRKFKSVAFRWVWTSPGLKRSFAGKVMTNG